MIRWRFGAPPPLHSTWKRGTFSRVGAFARFPRHRVLDRRPHAALLCSAPSDASPSRPERALLRGAVVVDALDEQLQQAGWSRGREGRSRPGHRTATARTSSGSISAAMPARGPADQPRASFVLPLNPACDGSAGMGPAAETADQIASRVRSTARPEQRSSGSTRSTQCPRWSWLMQIKTVESPSLTSIVNRRNSPRGPSSSLASRPLMMALSNSTRVWNGLMQSRSFR